MHRTVKVVADGVHRSAKAGTQHWPFTRGRRAAKREELIVLSNLPDRFADLIRVLSRV
jgi:hypothetical protein